MGVRKILLSVVTPTQTSGVIEGPGGVGSPIGLLLALTKAS